MGNSQERGAVLAGQTEKEVDDLAAGLRVEVSGGFIGKKHGGAVGQRARDGHALLFATGEFRGQMAGAGSEADFVEQLRGALAFVFASDQRRERDILEGGQLGQQHVALENKAHARVAHVGLAARGDAVEILVFKMHFAAARSFESGQRVKQRAFARARGTAKEDALAAFHIEIHAAQNLQFCRAEPELFLQSPRPQMDVVRRQHRGRTAGGAVWRISSAEVANTASSAMFVAWSPIRSM